MKTIKQPVVTCFIVLSGMFIYGTAYSQLQQSNIVNADKNIALPELKKLENYEPVLMQEIVADSAYNLIPVKPDTINLSNLTKEMSTVRHELELIKRKSNVNSAKQREKEDSLNRRILFLDSSIKSVNFDLANTKRILDSTERVYRKLLFQNDSASFQNFFTSLSDKLKEQDSVIKRNKALLNKDSLKLDNFVYDSTSLPGIFQSLIDMASESANTSSELRLILTPDMNNLAVLVNEFNALSPLFNYPEIPTAKIIEKLKPIRQKIIAQTDRIQDEEEAYKKRYHAYTDAFNEKLTALNTALKNKKPELQNQNASVLGKITTPLNDNAMLIPQVALFGFKKFMDSTNAIFGQAKLFFSAAGSDTNKVNNSTRLFLPEASTLGFMVDFVFAFDKKTYYAPKFKTYQPYHSLGVTTGFYYLHKKLNAIDNDKQIDFTAGVLQTKIGLEKTIVKNALLVYTNLNGIYVGKGLENYSKYYDPSSKMRWYIETGLKSYLTLSEDKSSNLIFELRLLPVNPVIKMITKSADKFFSFISIGYSKGFDF